MSMMPICSKRRSPRPFTAGIPPILGREGESAFSTPRSCATPARGRGHQGLALPGALRWGAPEEPGPTCSLQEAVQLGLSHSPLLSDTPHSTQSWRLEAAEGPGTHRPECTRTHTHARPCTRSAWAAPPGLVGAARGVSGFTRPQAHQAHTCPAQHG